MTYVAIVNMPGYMPEAEPAEFDTCPEAWQYILGELEWALEVEETQAGNFDHDYLDAHTWLHSHDNNMPGTCHAGGYAYSVELAE